MFVLFVLSIDPVAAGLMRYLEKQHPPLAEEDGVFVVEASPDFIVVLASGDHYVEGRPELSQLTHAGYLRVTGATRLWKQFPDSIIVMAGNPAETAAMKLIATRFDVPADSIVEENESRDTKDHPIFVKKNYR
ncbi:YdcF family protein [Verrucomicrobiales bacterium]|nr:YdcF family protein [Verrucomicrobiales bacterium]